MNGPWLPGAERERPKFAGFPTLAGDVTVSLGSNTRPAFPFRSWAAAERFAYPAFAVSVLSRCGSAAEAFFVRPFLERPGVTVEGDVAVSGSVRVELQVPARGYFLDLVVSVGDFRLAVEVDGLGFHRATAEAVAADYMRQRRIVCAGFTVVRFTAQEAFKDPTECWRQIDAILTSRRAR